ncbi:MAG: flagellar motor protein MotB [Gammaproteobacteria bacterium]|nr:MAG: flagellar motor protein MotB [Gammaproteobacteria bacterium]
MKCKNLSAIIGLVSLTGLTSSLAYAQESNWYIGGNIGQSRAHLDEQKIADDVIPPPFTNTYLDHNTIDGGYKIFGGYEINPHISIEAGFFDLGEFQFNHITTPDGLLKTNMQVRGINLDVVGHMPLSEKISAFARLGVTYALTQDTFTGSGAASGLGGELSDRDTFPKVGLGLQYAFNDSWAMRLEAERYRISNAITDHNEIDLFSVGVVYKFGDHKKSAQVAATPAPVVAPPAPRFEKVTISATELFKFDSSEVTQAAELEQLTSSLKTSVEPKEVKIIGYTDRIGTEQYNQSLSERRAEAVKNYMVGQGISSERLLTEGKGEKDPVVNCTEKNREKLIECLQPNRRVVIDNVTVDREVKP